MSAKMLGRKLKALRMARKLDQVTLAQLAEVTQPYIVALEKGRENPTLNTLANIATALKVGITDLFQPGDNDMNTQQLRKLIGKPLRLRPLPWRFSQSGQRLISRDDQWTLEGVTRTQVLLKNASTGHNAEIGHDNVREFRTPDFLLLRCQVIVVGPKILVEPFVTREHATR